MTYLVKTAGGIPIANCSTSGQDTEASSLLFTEISQDYEQ